MGHCCRPAELSSKRPVGRFRQVVNPAQHAKPRDPRFDDLSGTLNEELFDKSYAWLWEQRETEIKSLSRKLRKARHGLKCASRQARLMWCLLRLQL